MRVSRGTLGATAAALAIAVSMTGVLAGAATRPAVTSIKGVLAYGTASPEAVETGSTTPSTITFSVRKYGKAYGGVAVTLNYADLNYEANLGDCSKPWVLTIEQKFPGGKVGKTNAQGQLTLPVRYVAQTVQPGSFCVLYGGILGGTGLSIVPKGTGTVRQHAAVGENFYVVICQMNPADDPYVITQSAAHLTVATGGPHDPFTLTVKKTVGGVAVSGDNTIFYDMVHSVYQSCGNPSPTAPPGSNTNGTGHSTIAYVPSTTKGTCKVTAQEADTGQFSNVVKITQS